MSGTGVITQHRQEVSRGERFEFGRNWKRFLSGLTTERIDEAEQSLLRMLGVGELRGLTFLDIGCGSGLSSLVARRLGARVRSFDYDPESVECTLELKRRFYPTDPDWTAEAASILDADYVNSLGEYDIVYSWGVLHHTGDMRTALKNAAMPLRPGGKLFVAIYNDQGGGSVRWKAIKRIYNSTPDWLKLLLAVVVMGLRELRLALVHIARLRLLDYLRSWRDGTGRGMSRWHDLIDWIGGYPFEVAKPEEVFDFYRSLGFTLERLKTCGGGLGCNEFVFTKPRGGSA